jgi:hypothetical protein
MRSYIDARREFDVAVSICAGGTKEFVIGDRDSSAPPDRVPLLLAAARQTIRQQANEHLRALNPNAHTDIIDWFVYPPLSKKPEQQLASRKRLDDNQNPYVQPDDLLKSQRNLIILGDKESGKTCLAHYLSVQVSEYKADKPRLPVIIDFALLKQGRSALVRAIKGYFSDIDVGNVKSLIESGSFVFLGDNVQLSN